MESLQKTDLFEISETEEVESRITLDMLVQENGQNFSQGQRQLICLARAILRNKKFIFMDEATASVDTLTDEKIQNTIRSQFSDSTVICIAHRLRTVIDYDRILVLDSGKITELDTPLNLLMAKKRFYDMCLNSGDYDYLLETAKNSSNKLN